MPVYEHICDHCGPMELTRRMSEKAPTRCPMCNSEDFMQVVGKCHFIGACDAGQETMNNGAGMYYPQFGKQYLDPYTKTTINPAAHHRSRSDALEYAKRQEWNVEKT